MRLQLRAFASGLALWLLTLASAPALADNRFGSWLSVYADDDNLTVISPHMSSRADLGDELEFDLAFDVDVITAASVDVVTAASPRGYQERRQGGRLAATWSPTPKTQAGLAYLLSWEPDYQSQGVAVSGSREWIDRRLTTRLNARLLLDRVGRSGDDASLWHELTTSAASATLSWIFDRNTIGDLSYELQVTDGFQASPYRYVALDWGAAMTPAISVPEAVPSLRVRHALATAVRRALMDRWFGSLQYRLYVDSWGIVSHTGEAELQRAFAWDRLLLGISARGYRQSAADFHQRRYSPAPGSIPAYRSADKMLTQSWSVLAGLRAEFRYQAGDLIDEIRAVAKVELYEQHFQKFTPLTTRRALITSLGATLEF